MANEFNVDKSEYQSVFKVFDKENTGEISIQQVFELIGKLEEGESAEETKPKITASLASGAA